MFVERIITSLTNFRDRLLDTPFKGINERSTPIYNQKWLEKAVHKMPAGDGFDYCFVFSLCYAYTYLIATIPWILIAEALKMMPPKLFDKVSGSVKDINEFSRRLSFYLEAPCYFKQVAMMTGDISRMVEEVNKVRIANKLESHYFLTSEYRPQHYMHVTAAGIEINPFPGYHGEFVGFRVFQVLPMEVK